MTEKIVIQSLSAVAIICSSVVHLFTMGDFMYNSCFYFLLGTTIIFKLIRFKGNESVQFQVLGLSVLVFIDSLTGLLLIGYVTIFPHKLIYLAAAGVIIYIAYSTLEFNSISKHVSNSYLTILLGLVFMILGNLQHNTGWVLF